MSRYLFAAMPFTGHVLPVLAVASALAGRGHDVRLYTGGAFEPAVTAAGVRFVPWRDAPDFAEQRLADTFPRLVGRRGVAQLLVNMQDLFIGTAAAQVRDLEREWAREPWDVHVGDESSVAPGLFAERTGCPWVTIAVLPLYLESRQGPPAGFGMRPGRGTAGRARDAALRRLALVAGRPLTAHVERQRVALGLRPAHRSFARSIFSPELVLASGVPALDHGRTDRPESVQWVGALRGAAAAAPVLPEWWGDLDGRVVVAVTQGTQNVDPTDLLRPALEGLAGLDAVVVAVTGVRGRTELPFAVPGNARVADLLPFDALLPRTRVLVSNGGWGGTLRALAAGVPLVLAGGDLDKPEVAARVGAAGAGIDLRGPRPSAEAVRAAVERISTDGAIVAAARRIGAELAAAGGAARAAGLLESFARG